MCRSKAYENAVVGNNRVLSSGVTSDAVKIQIP